MTFRGRGRTTPVTADLVCRVDVSGNVLSAQGGERLPWDRATLVGGHLAAIVPRPSARELSKALDLLASSGAPQAVSFSTGEPGARRAFEMRLFRDADGPILAVVRDVSSDRNALLDAAAQRAFLRQVLDLDPNLIFAKDREGRFTLANRAVAAIYGTTPSGLVGKRDGDFNRNLDEVERFRRDDLEVMESLRPKEIAQEPMSSPDGTTRWFQTIKIPIVSPDGRAESMLGVATDISARKVVEEDLERRRGRLVRQQAALRDLALAQDPDLASALRRILTMAAGTLGVDRVGLWLLTSDGAVLRTDTVFDHGRILDEPPLHFLAKDHAPYFVALRADRSIAAHDARNDPRTSSFRESYLGPVALHAMLDVPIRSHGELIGVVCHEHRGGPRHWTIEEQDFAASIADFVALALSASTRRALEDQLRQAQKMEAVGLLAGGIAHDFNNLLNVIVGYAGLASEKLPRDHPATPHIQTMTDACLRAADLVRKILTFSRGQVLKIEPVEFGEILFEFSSLLRRILGEDIALQVDRPTEPLVVRADRTQLEQILLNLCTNARQAMPAGGSLRLSASACDLDERSNSVEPGMRAGRFLHLQVADTGHGIDELTMARLWEPFFTTKADGTGLGLSMVYGIVKQHEGLIRAESRIGHGSVFHVFLPLEPAATSAPIREPTPRRTGRGETLLVVEDELLIRELLEESLRELGYDVLIAEDGAAAVAIFEAQADAIDLVILDVVMPNLSGPAALSRMARIRPDVKALFMSGHAPESTRLIEVLAASGRAFLSKPFLLDALADTVREVLDGEVGSGGAL